MGQEPADWEVRRKVHVGTVTTLVSTIWYGPTIGRFFTRWTRWDVNICKLYCPTWEEGMINIDQHDFT